MQKIINGLSIAAFVMALSIGGGGLYGYFWVTDEENQEKLKQQLIDSVMQNIPIPGGLTGPALPTKAPAKRGATPGLPF